jgi:hypothetical protein
VRKSTEPNCPHAGQEKLNHGKPPAIGLTWVAGGGVAPNRLPPTPIGGRDQFCSPKRAYKEKPRLGKTGL